MSRSALPTISDAKRYSVRVDGAVHWLLARVDWDTAKAGAERFATTKKKRLVEILDLKTLTIVWTN